MRTKTPLPLLVALSTLLCSTSAWPRLWLRAPAAKAIAARATYSVVAINGDTTTQQATPTPVTTIVQTVTATPAVTVVESISVVDIEPTSIFITKTIGETSKPSSSSISSSPLTATTAITTSSRLAASSSMTTDSDISSSTSAYSTRNVASTTVTIPTVSSVSTASWSSFAMSSLPSSSSMGFTTSYVAPGFTSSSVTSLVAMTTSQPPFPISTSKTYDDGYYHTTWRPWNETMVKRFV